MLSKIEEIVKNAGELILSAGRYNGRAGVKRGDSNYVTEYDIAVQRRLEKELSALLPGASFIGEESAENDYAARGWKWIVDPIDGTTNFMHSLGHSAVSVALCEGDEVAAAVIYNPYSRELFSAKRGGGSRLNGEPVRVSEREIDRALVAFGTTPYDKTRAGETFGLAADCYKICGDVRRSGSAALDLAYVAAGRFEGFFEASLSVWDFAAGILLVREAGGVVTDFRGKPLGLSAASSVLAGSPRTHECILGLIRAKSNQI